MYENNLQSWAIFRQGPFSVNPAVSDVKSFNFVFDREMAEYNKLVKQFNETGYNF